MAEPAGRVEHLFIVRIWQESGLVRSSSWRGSAEHSGSGQRIYFTSLQDLDDFITLRLSPFVHPIEDEIDPC